MYLRVEDICFCVSDQSQIKMSFIMSASVLLFLLACPSIISEVVDFSECGQFFFNKQAPVILENSGQYKMICQKYRGSYRFATLHDTTNRIPLFSAYRVTTDKPVKRPSIEWMNEPQLEDSSDEMGVPYENQAIDEDFFNNGENMSRGHLFPCCHSCDEDTARATFTLTNIVPQKISFNGGSWSRMETKTREVMRKYCRDKMDQNKILAHVLTGAVPGQRYLNERVNIPSFMWMTFCCFNSSANSWTSQAYWAQNKDDQNKSVTISEESIQKLQEFLSNEGVKITQLFHNNCSENRNLKHSVFSDLK